MLSPFTILLRLLLRFHLRDCQSILDIGCGTGSPVQFVPGYKVGVEAHEPTLLEAQKNRTHDAFLKMDVTSLSPIPSASYDAVVALDIIEHLTTSQGVELLGQMERIARRKVIILTPNGFMPQLPSDNPFWQHQSGWNTRDFRSRNYCVRGFLGLKWLRGPEARLRFGPLPVVSLISLATAIPTYVLPSLAFSLLAWKTMVSSVRSVPWAE